MTIAVLYWCSGIRVKRTQTQWPSSDTDMKTPKTTRGNLTRNISWQERTPLKEPWRYSKPTRLTRLCISALPVHSDVVYWNCLTKNPDRFSSCETFTLLKVASLYRSRWEQRQKPAGRREWWSCFSSSCLSVGYDAFKMSRNFLFYFFFSSSVGRGYGSLEKRKKRILTNLKILRIKS